MGVVIDLVVVWLAGAGLVLLCARRPNAGCITFGGRALSNAGIILIYPLYTAMNLALVAAQPLLLRRDYHPAIRARLRVRVHRPHRPARAMAHRRGACGARSERRPVP